MKAMKEILRRTWAEIDLDALAADFQVVRACAGEGAQLCCVIKADAYGHGAVRMARELVCRFQHGGGFAASQQRD